MGQNTYWTNLKGGKTELSSKLGKSKKSTKYKIPIAGSRSIEKKVVTSKNAKRKWAIRQSALERQNGINEYLKKTIDKLEESSLIELKECLEEMRESELKDNGVLIGISILKIIQINLGIIIF